MQSSFKKRREKLVIRRLHVFIGMFVVLFFGGPGTPFAETLTLPGPSTAAENVLDDKSLAFPVENDTRKEDYIVIAPAFGSKIVIKARRSFGGSITSLVFRDKEYINSADKGRELQSAASFDGFGECYNPTEAGGQYDKYKSSSSLLLHARASEDTLETVTNMAFWLKPGQVQHLKRCGERKDVTTAQNSTVLSNYYLHKKVTAGYMGLQNVIQYLVTFRVPEKRSSGLFVPISAHAAADFDSFALYDPAAGKVTETARKAARIHLPVIMMTKDRKNALAIFCPDVKEGQNSWYGYRSFATTNVARCVFGKDNIAPGPNSFRAFVVVGTPAEVKTSLDSLADIHLK